MLTAFHLGVGAGHSTTKAKLASSLEASASGLCDDAVAVALIVPGGPGVIDTSITSSAPPAKTSDALQAAVEPETSQATLPIVAEPIEAIAPKNEIFQLTPYAEAPEAWF